MSIKVGHMSHLRTLEHVPQGLFFLKKKKEKKRRWRTEEVEEGQSSF